LPPAADEGEYLFALLDTVAQHEDLLVLPSLLSFVGTGTRVINAIADFGEEAVSQTLVIAATSPSPQDDPSMAMEVLKRMLEREAVRKPLSAASKRRIVDLASTRLSPGESVAVITASLRLAVATRDRALIGRVEELAASDRAAFRLGILREDERRSIQGSARRALRGDNR
jgi:hypothetical protein